MDSLVGEAGGRPYGSKTLEPAGFHTYLLQQLPFCTCPWVLTRVQAAGRDLDERPVGRVTVLLNEQDRRIGPVRIGREGHDSSRAGMTNHFELSGRAVGKSYGVHVQIDHTSRIDSLALELHACPRRLALEQPGERDFESLCEQVTAVAPD